MSGKIPHLELNPRDITVIEQVVKSYLAYLRKAIPPSYARDSRIKVLQNVRLRLANMPQEGAILLLTGAEIQALTAACDGFVYLVRQMVPRSQERDETLHLLEMLCQQLAAMLSPHLYRC